MAAAPPSEGLLTTVWFLALEFLPAGADPWHGRRNPIVRIENVSDAKSVSKLLRDAARRALTMGRLRPVTRALEVLDGFKRNDDVNEVAETFREAWAVERETVASALLGKDAEYLESARIDSAPFFGIMEPTLDGLERIVASVEHVQLGEREFFLMYKGGIWQWIRGRGDLNKRGLDLPLSWNDCRWRVFRALGHWSNADHISALIISIIGVGEDEDLSVDFAYEITAGWDPAKAENVIDAVEMIETMAGWNYY